MSDDAASGATDRPDWQAFGDELRDAEPSHPPPGLASRVRHIPDKLLHPLRRRLELARLARRGGARSVLFVCAGNIYRSPFAATLFQAVLPSPFQKNIRCGSVGFIGHDRPCPPDAIGAAGRRGLDLSGHRSTMVTPAEIASADLIVVMAPEQKRMICERFGRSRRDVVVLGDLDPEPIETREVADPWDQPERVLEGSYDRVSRCVRELAGVITGLGGSAR